MLRQAGPYVSVFDFELYTSWRLITMLLPSNSVLRLERLCKM